MELRTAPMRELLYHIKPFTERIVSLHPGQILFATIERLYPNEHAQIRFGANRLIARLEVPLESGKGYWLQVDRQQQATPQLNLIATKESGYGLFKQLSLPNDKGTRALVQMLMEEPFLLSRTKLLQAGKWVSDSDDISQALKTIKWMLVKNMPLSESIFHALYMVEDEQSIHELLVSLRVAISSKINNNKVERDILQLLHSMERNNQQTVINQPFEREEVSKELKRAIKRMGIFYEGQITSKSSERQMNKSLKPLLITYVQDEQNRKSIRNIAQQLLHRMNGQQILSNENGPVQQMVFDVPIQLFGENIDLKMQWTMKRKKDGKVDPDFCRIICYLHFKNLKETVIDINIQQRIVHVTITNESIEIESLAHLFMPTLKQQLNKLNYSLSHVQFKQHEQKVKTGKSERSALKNNLYSGVDIRI